MFQDDPVQTVAPGSLAAKYLQYKEQGDSPQPVGGGGLLSRYGRSRLEGAVDPGVEQALATTRPVGFLEALTTTASGRGRGAGDLVGYYSTIKEVGDWGHLLDLARKADAGEASEKELEELIARATYIQRPQSWHGIAGGILAEAPVWIQEMLGGGAVAGKVAGKLGGKAAREYIEGVVENVAKKQIAGALVRTGAQGAAIGVANEALTLGTGVRASAYQRMFASMGTTVSEDEAGDLSIAFLGSSRDFMDVLPAAALDRLIEPISERSGGALGALVPARVHGAMGAIAGWWMKKHGKGAEAFMSTLKKAGWSNLAGEFFEERYGGVLRAGAGLALPEDFGGWEEIFPGTEELVGELAGLAALGGAIRGGAAVFDKFAPGVSEQGVETEARPDTPLEETTSELLTDAGLVDTEQPSDVEGAGEDGGAAVTLESPRFEQEEEPDAVRQEEATPEEVESPADDPGLRLLAAAEGQGPEAYEEVEAETDEHRAAERLQRERAEAGEAPLKIRWARGMKNQGAFVRPGEVWINPDAADPARVLERHEAAHSFVHGTGGTEKGDWIGTMRMLRREDPHGARMARWKHASDAGFDLSTPEGREGYRKAYPRGVRAEEAFATHSGILAAYTDMLQTAEGRKHMLRVARRSPGLWQKIKDWIAQTYYRVTGRKPSLEAFANERGLSFKGGVRKEAAVAAAMLDEAMSGSRMSAEERAADPRFAEAWHGTGAEFDKFSDEKIGTGEGAQAYGYGHYFAGRRGVAEWYKEKERRKRGGRVTIQGEEYAPDSHETPQHSIATYVSRGFGNGMTVAEALDWAKAQAKMGSVLTEREDNAPPEERAEFIQEVERNKAILRALEGLSDENVSVASVGHLLRVDLAPAEEDYLLHDAPLSEQSEKVRAALGLGQPSRAEGIPDSVVAAADRLRNLAVGPSFGPEGFGGLDVPAQRRVLQDVAAAVQHPEILDAVVRALPVDVVNVFRGEQLAPEVALHDDAVLHDLFAADVDHAVATGRQSPASLLVLTTARLATEQVDAARGTGDALETLAAGSAGAINHIKRSIDPLGPDATGADAYRAVAAGFDAPSVANAQRAASQALLAAGIRGIKYLDGDSRAKGEGAFNYVIFDPADVSIEARFAPMPGPVDSPEFKRWFGDSKVVDTEGKPLVVYHGSALPGITVFDPKRAGDVRTSDWAREGVYFTPSAWMADGYRSQAVKETDGQAGAIWDAWQAEAARLGTDIMSAGIDLGRDSADYKRLKEEYENPWRARLKELEGGAGGEVYAVFLSVQNPYIYVPQGITDPYLSETARGRGHDGIFIQDEEGNVEEIVVFSPTQIKSATGNRGTFDPSDPDIRFAPQPPAPLPEGLPERTQAAMQRGPKGKQEGAQLAKTTDEEAQREVQEAVDEALEEGGFWKTVTNEDMRTMQRAARQRVMADPRGVARRLLIKHREGETLNTEETFELRYLTHSSAKLALQMEDELAWKQVYALHLAYRESGRELSRAMRARKEMFNEEVMGEELMALILARPTLKASERIDKLMAERQAEGTTNARKKEIDAEIDKILGVEAKKNARVYRALRKMGIDPATITKHDWQDDLQRARLIHAVTAARADAADKAREFLYASMLSGFATHFRNFRGNAANLMLSKYLQDFVEASINVVARDPDAPTFGEMKYMMPAFKEAGRRFFKAFVTQMPEDLTALEGDTTKLGEGVRGRAIASPLFRPLRAISLDLLLAADEAFKGLIGPTLRAQYAHREARKEGLKGEALDRRVQELMEDPSVLARARADELKLTFQDPAEKGSILDAVEGGAEKLRRAFDNVIPLAGTIHLPFVKTPLRLMREGLRRSPLTLLTYTAKVGTSFKGYKGGRRALVRDTADAIISAFIFWGIMAMLDDEDESGMPLLTGAPASDFGERALQYRTKAPYSVTLFGQTFSYKQMDPIMLGVASTLDTARAMRNAAEKGDQEAATAGLKALSTSIGKAATDATYLRTLGDFMKLQERGTDMSAASLAFRTYVQGWMPNAVRHNLRALDPYLRESRVRKFEDMDGLSPVLKRAPYSLLPSKSIAPPPKQDIWGRDILKDSSPFTSSVWARVLPVFEQTASGGPALKYDLMLLRLKDRIDRGEVDMEWSPPRAHSYHFREGGETRYWSDEEYHEFVRMSGDYALQRLERQRLNLEEPGEKELKAIKDALSDGRRRAKSELLQRRRDQ